LWSAGENGGSDLHFREKSERHFRSVVSLGLSGFGGEIVLVVSPDESGRHSFFQYSVRSLYESRDHRDNLFQLGLATKIRIIVNRIANLQDIMNCGKY
jgi:hypothetical protein